MRLSLFLLSIAWAISGDAQGLPAGDGVLPKFEVTSVKLSPGQGVRVDDCSGEYSTNHPAMLQVRRKTLRQLVLCAYGLEEYQLVGGAAWTKSERYEIDAKAEAPISRAQKLRMLQRLLAERFDLVLHRESKTMGFLVLTVDGDRARFGPQFHLHQDGEVAPAFPRADGPRPFNPMTMSQWAKFVQFLIEHSPGPASYPPVVDKTGLDGVYAITLLGIQPEMDLSDWIQMFRRQLGLKLQDQKLLTEVVSIDSCNPPEANE